MKILILGSKGMLGSQLTKHLSERGHSVYPVDLPEIDIRERSSIAHVFKQGDYHYAINCAAYTDVARAESEKSIAYAINAFSVGMLANYCSVTGTKLIHFSTDFVFDGKKEEPYTEEDKPNPLNVYGASKLRGEKEIRIRPYLEYVILRLQWLYGPNGTHFFSKLNKAANDKSTLSVPVDEIGCPCSTEFVSNVVSNVIDKQVATGIYHCTHDHWTNRYSAAKYYLNRIGYKGVVEPRFSDDSIVKRPLFGAMGNSKLCKALGVESLGNWQDDLTSYIEKEVTNG